MTEERLDAPTDNNKQKSTILQWLRNLFSEIRAIRHDFRFIRLKIEENDSVLASSFPGLLSPPASYATDCFVINELNSLCLV
jgi:hypothetical protein